LLSDVISFEVKAVWATPTIPNTNPPRSAGPDTGYSPAGSWTVPAPGGGVMSQPNTDVPFDYLPTPQWPIQSNVNRQFSPAGVMVASNTALANAGYRVFDTWSSAAPLYAQTTPLNGWNNAFPNNQGCIPLRIRIKALQIQIRVWDRKSEQARQITIVQDM
jgi:hypothetical protein